MPGHFAIALSDLASLFSRLPAAPVATGDHP